MRVCLDTNVVIDILGKTSDLLDSYAAFDLSLLHSFEIFVPITSTTDIAYILPRRNYASAQQAKELLVQLLSLVQILDARSVDAEKALSSNMPDYEDALLAFMAQRNSIDLIITRNLKDFEHSPVPAMSPRQFVEIYKPHTVTYAALDTA
ncbi:MAG: PIN domain-containing protein [Coriobacteriales bacterium]|jgi:predicted nucleic acid-binding protein|nr:PIN domain-containing protein [Coriobacteriales bacterium]